MIKDAKTKFLLDLVKPYKHIVVLVVLMSILGSGFDGISIGLLVPLLSSLQKMNTVQQLPRVLQWFMDFLQPFSTPQQIMLALGFVILAVILKNLFLAVSVRLGHWLSTLLLANLRMQAATLLMRVGIGFHHQSKAGELINNAVGNTINVELFLRFAVELLANSLTLAVLVAMLFLLSWQLALLSVLLGAIFFYCIHYYTKNAQRIGKEVAETERDFMNTVHESLSAIPLIKSYSQEPAQISSWHEKITANRKASYRRNFTFFSIHPLTDVLGAFAIAILFVTAMLTYKLDTQLILTQLLPFIYILLRIVPLAKILNGQRVEVVSRWPYVELVQELLRTDDKPFIPDGHKIFSGLQHEIRFRAVTFAYNGNPKPVLHQVSFSIPAGRTTAIIGESGAGKSTVANLLLRFYDPQQGEILLDDKFLPNFRIESYHRKIGVVSQDTFLFSHTVKFNIAFSAEGTPTDEQIIAAAKKAGAHEFIMELPHGYDTFVGDRGVQLSGGQRQRISIARAFLRDPEILILDEATSALDVQTERRIHQAIAELSHGRTVIIIAHRLSTIRNADQIIVLKNGRVIETGLASKILNQKNEHNELAYAP